MVYPEADKVETQADGEEKDQSVCGKICNVGIKPLLKMKRSD